MLLDKYNPIRNNLYAKIKWIIHGKWNTEINYKIIKDFLGDDYGQTSVADTQERVNNTIANVNLNINSINEINEQLNIIIKYKL